MAANSQYISNTRNDETKSRGKFDWILGIILIAALFLYGWAT